MHRKQPLLEGASTAHMCRLTEQRPKPQMCDEWKSTKQITTTPVTASCATSPQHQVLPQPHTHRSVVFAGTPFHCADDSGDTQTTAVPPAKRTQSPEGAARSVRLRDSIDFVHPAATAPTHAGSREALAERLAAARPVVFRGRGELLQVPWQPRHGGLVLCLTLRSGFASMLFGLLALGFRVVALCVESDPTARSVIAHNFPDAVLVDNAEDITAETLQLVLQRRSFAFIVCGSSASLLGCEYSVSSRTLHAELFRRLAQGIRTMKVVPVISIFEDFATVQPEILHWYSDFFNAMPVCTQAAEFGWVSRHSLWWIVGPQNHTGELLDGKCPQDWSSTSHPQVAIVHSSATWAASQFQPAFLSLMASLLRLIPGRSLSSAVMVPCTHSHQSSHTAKTVRAR